MAKDWRQDNFDCTQKEIAEIIGTSQQNVNDTERRALTKIKKEFLKIYTIDEIRSLIRNSMGGNNARV